MRPVFFRILWMALGGGIALATLLSALPVSAAPPIQVEPAEPEAPGAIAGMVVNDQGTPLAGMTVVLARYGFGGYAPVPPAIPGMSVLPTSAPPAGETAAGEMTAAETAGSGWGFLPPIGTGRTTLTDDQGRFLFSLLAGNSYQLAAYDSNGLYGSTIYSGTNSRVSPTNLIVNADRQTVTLTLAPAAVISGSVTAAEGYNLAGASVVLYAQADLLAGSPTGADYLASEQDTYHFTHLAPGSYVLCASAQLTTTLGNHYVNECYEDQNSLLASPIVMMAGETRTIDLAVGDLPALSTVRGTVHNANGQALAGMTVFGYGSIFSGGTVQTDSAGVYTMPLVAPGSLQLTAFDPQGFYQRKPYPDSGSYGDGTSLEVAPSVTVTANFTLRPAGLIHGQVFVDGDPTYTCFVDAVRIEPMPYPPVYVTGSSLCDSSGRYTVTGLAAGSYRVSASVAVAEMYLTGNFGGANGQPVAVTEGQTRSGVDIRLGAGIFGGEVSGRVTSAGRPAAAVQVELFTQTGSFLNKQMTDAQGRYQFRGLVIPQDSAGRLPPYFLHVVDPLARYAQSCYLNTYSSFYTASDCPITTPAGITATTDITLPAGAALSGQVVDPAGHGEAGVSVRLYYARPIGLSDGYPWRDYWALSSTTSDANGFYRFGGLRAGRYVVGAVAPAAPPVYYFYGPAAKIELAPLIALSTGQQRTGLTLVLAKMLELFLPVVAR